MGSCAQVCDFQIKFKEIETLKNILKNKCSLFDEQRG